MQVYQAMKYKQFQIGESTRTITVTAENGETREYIIHINKKVTNNSYLASLVINGYELDKEFKKDEYNYTITVPYDKSILLSEEVTAIPEDENATVQKTSGLVLSTVGKNKYVILVTAKDGFTTSQYVVNVIREKNDHNIQISGKVLTENEYGKHLAEITIYDKITKEEVRKQMTEEDGEFNIETTLGIYNIVVTKPGYLSYTLTNVNLSDSREEKINIGDNKIYAGDMHKNGEIDINDLVLMNDMCHEDISVDEKYDINGDGVIDIMDRGILKRNYGKKAEIK